jgi:uncharacterized protein YecE (DUF72 family)
LGLEKAEGTIVDSPEGGGPANVHVGTSGWSYPGWRGRFYPPGLASRGWLPYYSQTFDTVEVNMTFYRLPKPDDFKKWADLTPPHFTFTLKANRQITHSKRLKDVGHEVSYFYHLAGNLGKKLGCILFQMPPAIIRNDRLLRDFLAVLSPEFKNVVEFRDPSWYAPDVYEILRSRGAILCIVSSAKVPAVAVRTSDTAYFRFHGLTGGYRHDYSEAELGEWAGVVRTTGAAETFAYFNNDYQAAAVRNAIRLRELLTPAIGVDRGKPLA